MAINPLLPSAFDIFWGVTLVAVGVALLTLWGVALLQIARATMEDTARAVWVLIVVLAPVIGAIAWFAIGRPTTAPFRS
jgi:Phospholipase_D-nuclease N-terminal